MDTLATGGQPGLGDALGETDFDAEGELVPVAAADVDGDTEALDDGAADTLAATDAVGEKLGDGGTLEPGERVTDGDAAIDADNDGEAARDIDIEVEREDDGDAVQEGVGDVDKLRHCT